MLSVFIWTAALALTASRRWPGCCLERFQDLFGSGDQPGPTVHPIRCRRPVTFPISDDYRVAISVGPAARFASGRFGAALGSGLACRRATPDFKTAGLIEKETFVWSCRRVGHRAGQYRRARWPALLSQTLVVSYERLRRPRAPSQIGSETVPIRRSFI